MAYKSSLREIMATAAMALDLRDNINEKTGVKTAAAMNFVKSADKIAKAGSEIAGEFKAKRFAAKHEMDPDRLTWDNEKAAEMIALLTEAKTHTQALADEDTSGKKYSWGHGAGVGSAIIVNSGFGGIIANEKNTTRDPGAYRSDPIDFNFGASTGHIRA